ANRDAPSFFATVHNFAMLCFKEGDYKRAETEFQRALEMTNAVPGSPKPAQISCRNHLGDLYRVMGEFDRAEYQLMEALRLLEATTRTNSYEDAQCYNNLGLVDQDRYQF